MAESKMVPEHLDSLELSKIETTFTPSTWYYAQRPSSCLNPSCTRVFHSSALRCGIAGSESFCLQGLRSQSRCLWRFACSMPPLHCLFQPQTHCCCKSYFKYSVKMWGGLGIRIERFSIVYSSSLLSPASRLSNLAGARTLCIQYLSICFLQHSPLP